MRLSNATMNNLPASIQRPDYDRAKVVTGIVHLGIGAFHRAHQAAYTDSILKDDPNWGILGVSLRSPDTRDALLAQDGLYTLAVRDGSGTFLRIIGALTGLLVAPENPQAVLEALCAPTTRIVTLTVTEKGYCHNPATGALREEDADIQHDLAHLDAPRTAIGFLVSALKIRLERGIAPFTILSCDNLPANGETVKGIITRFASLLDSKLAAHITKNVACPSSMVDRIVPATTDADKADTARMLGLEDHWPVMTEPFSQWVIEDHFPSGRPDWARAGAQFTGNVKPYELMKLRLLNGSHSTIAYLGYLMGHETVSDAMAEPGFSFLIRAMMDAEITPTLPVLPGFDLELYKSSLLARFANPALRHRTWQIAMDGSQKLPQRLLGTISDRLEKGQGIERLALGVAGWMRYVQGTDETGMAIDVRDPLATRFAAIAVKAGQDHRALMDGLLGITEIFNPHLVANSTFKNAVEAWLALLFEQGARAALAKARLLDAEKLVGKD